MAERRLGGSAEARLDAIRREAQRTARVEGLGVRPAGAPFPPAVPRPGPPLARPGGPSPGAPIPAPQAAPPATAETGYYGLPLLKRPTWTWEVPIYFFVGGAAGAAALIAAVAHRLGEDDGLARDARWIAAAGAAVSPPLLIADLGRPERFLNMLRVFKPQSPMSVGSWTLVAFGSSASAAAAADLLARATDGALPVRLVGDAAELVAGATGLLLATYTGVLIGVTAIPVWSENVALLPPHFATSGMASAVGLLELLGHRPRALHYLGLGTAAFETAIGVALETRRRPGLRPLKTGRSGALMRAAGLLSGPIPLALRLASTRRPRLRTLAAVSALAGSLLTRIAWVGAGHASADDPSVPLDLPSAKRLSP
jgi:hypothetical protein